MLNTIQGSKESAIMKTWVAKGVTVGCNIYKLQRDYDMLNVAISPLIDKGNECKQSKHTLNFELGKGRASQGCLASQGVARAKITIYQRRLRVFFRSFQGRQFIRFCRVQSFV